MASAPRLKAAPFGERGLLIEIEAPPAKIADIARRIAEADPTLDVGTGLGTIAVVDAAPLAPLRRAEVQQTISRCVLQGAATGAAPTTHRLRVVYDGPDLDEVAERVGMSVVEVVRAHTEREVEVEVAGFLPGFAYLGEVAPALQLPRRASPRRRVAAGSVGLAGRHTGVYPTRSPGGWNLIGRAVAPDLFDPGRDPPARLAVGDRVRFEQVDPADAPAVPDAEDPPLEVPEGAEALRLDAVSGLVTVQDGGRVRWLTRGVPASGALDPVALAAANLAVGNDAAAPGLEIAMGQLRATVRGPLLCSIDGEPPFRVRAGESLTVPAGPRLARYLAVRGGIDVPEVLGSRSTAVAAALGGRPLRKGDVLPVGIDPGTRVPDRSLLLIPSSPDPLVLRVDVLPVASPLTSASLAALLGPTFVVSLHVDRTGVRLTGEPLPLEAAPEPRPRPVLPGVVQILPTGEPVVLGPDAGITGGYPVAGVLRKTSLWALLRLRPGARVRFERTRLG